MPLQSSIALIGDAWRRINLSHDECQSLVLRLRSMGMHVATFGRDGWDCEVDGTQVFRATALSEHNPPRYHVRLNAKVFPDV